MSVEHDNVAINEGQVKLFFQGCRQEHRIGHSGDTPQACPPERRSELSKTAWRALKEQTPHLSYAYFLCLCPVSPVEAAVLNGFGDVFGFDLKSAFHIGRAGNF
jgi:hypothetical protein